MKQRLKNTRIAEWLALILFAILYLLVSVFHEPWFDEAQAWQIAKCASLRELLFVIPHYEGHPPLWHLILAIPAKLGVPFEVGLKTIGFLISAASAALLLFRSRFPRFVRIALVFSYFFFYQYGIIVRPYGLMLMLFLLLGTILPERDNHPWQCFILLLLICLTGAYGIVLAGGISICIVWELLRAKGIRCFLAEMIQDRRTLALLVLLAAAILLILEIMPRKDTYATVFPEANPFWICLIYALFAFPIECLITTSTWQSTDRQLLQISNIEPIELIILCVVGAVLWIFIVAASSKRNLKYLLVPFILFACFAAKVYFSPHHLGNVFILLLFWGELLCADNERFALGKTLLARIAKKESDHRLLQRCYLLVVIACLTVPLIWTVTASCNEIRYDYYFGRSISAFLRENGLDKLRILADWHERGSLIPQSEGDEEYINTVMIGTAVPINAYFDHNLFFNLNHGLDDQAFIYHRRPSLAESREDITQWAQNGLPELIIGHPDLSLVYGDSFSYQDYSLVSISISQYIWKTAISPIAVRIYLRNDLLVQYHLDPLIGGNYAYIDGFQITEEMRQQYEAGVPVEEILKPYFEALFGEEQ